MLPVRFHHLAAVGRSAAHGKLCLDRDEQGEEDESTQAMALGTAIHRRILGGEPPPPPVVYPGKVRRGKEWERFKALHSRPDRNERIITATQAEREEAEEAKVDAMALAIEAKPFAVELLTQGKQEQTLLYDWMGRACRSTPDCFNDARVVELKSTICADPFKFKWDALRRNYPAALAWYKQAVALSGFGQPQEAYIVAVESSPPFPVTVMRLTPQALDIGLRQVRLWFERLIACEASGAWPGYCESVVDFDIEDDEAPPLDFSGLDGGSQEISF